jgi:hypothetical protein
MIARDRHMEVITSIASLRAELTATRLEVKTDLAANRVENIANLAHHVSEDDKRFSGIEKQLENIAAWKNKTLAYASVIVFICTTASGLLTAAFATGRLG